MKPVYPSVPGWAAYQGLRTTNQVGQTFAHSRLSYDECLPGRMREHSNYPSLYAYQGNHLPHARPSLPGHYLTLLTSMPGSVSMQTTYLATPLLAPSEEFPRRPSFAIDLPELEGSLFLFPYSFLLNLLSSHHGPSGT